MKVVDAGVVVELFVNGLDPRRLGTEELVAPHLIDSEVLSAFRGLAGNGSLSQAQARAAVDGFADFEVRRYPAHQLRARMWELRDNLTAYDATYVSLAEWLGTSLLTTDARLASAPTVRCDIELL